MSDEINRQELEARISKLRARRDKLVDRKASHVARLHSSQDELRRLRAEAEEHGWDLKELPNLLAEKKRKLNAEVALFEEALEEAETHLERYEV